MAREMIPDAMIRVIRDATRAGNATLQGATIVRQGDDYALMAPNGEVYLISITAARITPTTPTGGQGDG